MRTFDKTKTGKDEPFIHEELDRLRATGAKPSAFNLRSSTYGNAATQASTPFELHQQEKRQRAERTGERIAARKEDFAGHTSPRTQEQQEFKRGFSERKIDREAASAPALKATTDRIAARKAAEANKVRVDLPRSMEGTKSPEVMARIEERTKARQAVVDTAISDREKGRIATQQKIAAKTRAREGGTPFEEAAKPMTRFEQAKADQQAAFASGKEGKKAAFAARKEQLRAAFAESHNKGADMIDKLKPGAAAEASDPMLAVQQQQLAEMKLANTKIDLLVGAVKTVGEQVAASGGYAK